jgi:hypothetical protein
MDNNFVDLESNDPDDEIVNKILENISVVDDFREVRLPSLGLGLYDITSETVHVRGMKFEDEKVLASLKDKTKVMDVLISRCVKEEIPLDLLIPQDKIYLMIQIRAMSIGSNQDVTVTCPSCSKKSVVTIDVLETFPCNYPEEPLEKIIEVELPMIKKKAKLKRLTSSDITKYSNEDLLNNLWRFVLSIDENTNPKIRAKVLDKLPKKDITAITESLMSEGIGLDTRFLFSCISCGHEELTDFNFQNGFFTMT